MWGFDPLTESMSTKLLIWLNSKAKYSGYLKEHPWMARKSYLYFSCFTPIFVINTLPTDNITSNLL